MRRRRAALGIVALAALLALVGREGRKLMDGTRVDSALRRAEASGRMDGMGIEYFVGGGLPPPYYRLDSLRVMTKDGQDVLEFASPNYDPALAKGKTVPMDVYTLPAKSEDVVLMARHFRAAFQSPEPSPPAPHRKDALRTELVFAEDAVNGRPVQRVYAGGAPPELADLRAAAETLIARVKAQGVHTIRQ